MEPPLQGQGSEPLTEPGQAGNHLVPTCATLSLPKTKNPEPLFMETPKSNGNAVTLVPFILGGVGREANWGLMGSKGNTLLSEPQFPLLEVGSATHFPGWQEEGGGAGWREGF